MDIESYLRKINKEDFNKPKVREKYDKVITYLFQNKFGSFNEIDVKLIICYIIKEMLRNAKISEGLTVRVLKKGERDDRLKDAKGVCIFTMTDHENVQEIIYSYEIVEGMMRNDYHQFLSELFVVFRELDHFCQNTVIKQDFWLYKSYLMTVETLVRTADEDFYEVNCNHLLKETHAKKYGLKFALEFLKHYRRDIYDMYPQDKIQKIYKECDDDFFQSQLIVFEEAGDSMKQLDKIATSYVANHPEIIDICPVLNVVYNEDGTKKGLKTLLLEREKLINDEQKMSSKNSDEKDINALYNVIINERYLDIDNELDIITDYIRETKDMDKFVYDLLKYRLGKKGFSRENQDLLISSIQRYLAENGKSNVK